MVYGRWGIFPLSSPLTVCVGRPIDVPELLKKREGEMQEEEKVRKLTDIVHQRFIEEIDRLFEENKAKYGYEENTLQIV